MGQDINLGKRYGVVNTENTVVIAGGVHTGKSEALQEIYGVVATNNPEINQGVFIFATTEIDFRDLVKLHDRFRLGQCTWYPNTKIPLTAAGFIDNIAQEDDKVITAIFLDHPELIFDDYDRVVTIKSLKKAYPNALIVYTQSFARRTGNQEVAPLTIYEDIRFSQFPFTRYKLPRARGPAQHSVRLY